jgi:hypothetical protein
MNSNDLGEYRLFGLAPGRYLLSAVYRPNGFMMESTQGGPTESYAPTYYPGTSAPETAAIVEVAPGAQLRGMDIRLLKIRTAHIRGRVTGSYSSRSLRNAMIALQPKSDVVMNFMARNTSRPYNEKGEFILSNVTPGSYVLTANVNDEGKTLMARTSIEVGGSPIDGVALQLAPGVEIAGRVVIEGTQTSTSSPNLRLSLQARSPMMFGPGAYGGDVKEDGTFRFTNVYSDVFDLRVFGVPEGGYLKAIRIGNNDATETPLDFTTGVPADELTIVISMTAGQLTGTVQNEKQDPAVGAIVVAVPQGKRREIDRYYFTSNTDQYGKYTLKGVAPGEYRVYAFENVEFGAYQDPEWLKPFESKGEQIAVNENDKQSLDLKLVPQAQQ